MAEALTNARAGSAFVAYSAGIDPKPEVSPVVTDVLLAHGIPAGTLRTKRWTEFTGPGAPRIDFLIVTGERNEGDLVPEWPGETSPVRANWQLPDPAEGSQEMDHLRARAETNYQIVGRCVRMFLSIPDDVLNHLATREPHGLDIDETAISLMSQVFRPAVPV